jgi:hypothetical protein
VCFFATLEGNISLAQFPEARFWPTSGWPKITGQFSESRSATPPPDVFWRMRSCILFQLDFPLQAEKPRLRDNAGGEAIFDASRTRTTESFGCRTKMLTWKTSQLGFPLERAWSSLKSGKIVTERTKFTHLENGQRLAG